MRGGRKNIANVRKSVVLWGSAFLFVANLWVSSVALGVVAGLVWIVVVISTFAQQDRFGASELERYLFSSLFVMSLIGLMLSVGYLASSLSPVLIVGVIFLVTLLCSRSRAGVRLSGRTEGRPYMLGITLHRLHWTNFLAVLIGLGDIFILLQAVGVRTSDALSSPWSLFGASIFILFGFISFALLVIADERKDDLSIFLTVFHFFTAILISTIVFKIGFGFDPFIHRAAETELSLRGVIEPKQILYTGQYVMVTAIHKLTALPVKIVDTWMVPLVSSLLIPLAAYLGLHRGFDLAEREARTWAHVIFLLPPMPLTFTVPFNITFALFFSVVFFLLLDLNRVQWGILYLVSFFAILTHPLLGVPMMLLIAMVHGWNRKLMVLTSIVAIPVMFAVNNIGAGLDTVSFLNPLARSSMFFNLFIDPYQHNLFPIPQIWEALYLYKTWVMWMMLGVATLGARHMTNLRTRSAYAASAFSLMLGVFLLSTMFVFKDIIWYEQAEFSLRLIQGISLLALPFVALHGATKTRSLSEIRRYILFGVVAIAMTCSWYFSYPRLDPKSITPGVSVSATDVEAVYRIDEMAGGDEYIVLSGQMMSAVALQEFGFRDYVVADGEEYLWYALPTGGVLYQEFLRYLNQGADREVIDLIENGVGVHKIYTVIHSYTPGSESLVENAKKTADKFEEVGGGSVVLFEYSY